MSSKPARFGGATGLVVRPARWRFRSAFSRSTRIEAACSTLLALLNPGHREAGIIALGLELDHVSDLELLECREVPDLVNHGDRFLESEAWDRTVLERD